MVMYQIAKDFQTLLAALVAFGAAWVAFLSAQKAARIQADTAEKTKSQELAWAKKQADEALANKRSAFITWLYLRVSEANRILDKQLITLIEVRRLLGHLNASEQTEKDPFVDAFRVRTKEARRLAPVFSNSDLADVSIEFLIGLHRDDQKLFSSAVQTIKFLDRGVEACKASLSANVSLSAEARERLKQTFDQEVESALFWREQLRREEGLIADQMNALHGTVRPKAEQEPAMAPTPAPAGQT